MIKSIKRITAAVLFASITVSSMFFMTSCKKKGTSSKNRIVVFNYGDYIDQEPAGGRCCPPAGSWSVTRRPLLR